ncbi:hypothetical protein ACEWY4_012883 [Coilia grayii]|uniref:ILEI/PANDER domain-containing protein n=1 Tax=Coilia grayii TaxID=363190 RepID=A0ABD1JUW4_9TELE
MIREVRFYVFGICGILSFLTFNKTCVQRQSPRFKHQQDNAKLSGTCPSPRDCPPNHFAFYIRSGLANVIGPKICFDGEVVMSGTKMNVGQGLNIVLLNGDSGNIISSGFYTGADDMLVFLRGIQHGQIMLVASFDDPAPILTDKAREILKALGSSAIQTVGVRDGWLFAGQKGSDGNPFEKHISNDEKTNKFEKWPGAIELSGCFLKRT